MPRQTSLDGYELIAFTKRSEHSERIDIKKTDSSKKQTVRFLSEL